jgi:hypothetical protein
MIAIFSAHWQGKRLVLDQAELKKIITHSVHNLTIIIRVSGLRKNFAPLAQRGRCPPARALAGLIT